MTIEEMLATIDARLAAQIAAAAERIVGDLGLEPWEVTPEVDMAARMGFSAGYAAACAEILAAHAAVER